MFRTQAKKLKIALAWEHHTFTYVWFAAYIAGLLLIMVSCARSEEPACPPPHKSCKIIAVSPEDEAMLTNPNMILDMAEWASRPLYQYVRSWRDKLRDAPVHRSEAPAAPAPSPTGPQ